MNALFEATRSLAGGLASAITTSVGHNVGVDNCARICTYDREIVEIELGIFDTITDAAQFFAYPTLQPHI